MRSLFEHQNSFYCWINTFIIFLCASIYTFLYYRTEQSSLLIKKALMTMSRVVVAEVIA